MNIRQVLINVEDCDKRFKEARQGLCARSRRLEVEVPELVLSPCVDYLQCLPDPLGLGHEAFYFTKNQEKLSEQMRTLQLPPVLSISYGRILIEKHNRLLTRSLLIRLHISLLEKACHYWAEILQKI